MKKEFQTISGDTVLSLVKGFAKAKKIEVEGKTVFVEKIAVVNADVPEDSRTKWAAIGYGYLIDSCGSADGTAIFCEFTGKSEDWKAGDFYDGVPVTFKNSGWKFSKWENSRYFWDVKILSLPRILEIYEGRDVSVNSVTFDMRK